MQVCRNIKTQLRADMELVMQKSEDSGRRSGARGRRRGEEDKKEIFGKQAEECRDV